MRTTLSVPPLLAACLFLVSPAAVAAEKEALVIGCSRYENVTPLPLVATDVRDVSATLTALGFHVTQVADPGIVAFNSALMTFQTTAKDARVALVYYSGHGLEHGQINYLLPVDCVLDSAAELRSQAVNVETLLTDLKATGAPARTVILDCCRDNPFGAASKSWKPATKSAVDANVLRALGEAEIPEATMVVFASSSGRKAAARLNNDSTHSPFTAAFLEFVQIPGLSVRDIFDKVEDGVSESTEGRQTPVVKYGGSSRVFRELVLLPGGGKRLPLPRVMPSAADALAASKDAPFINSLRMEFVPVKGVSGVLFSRWETRVRDYAAFCQDTGRLPEKPDFRQTGDHPAVNVSFTDAQAFCAWLSKKEGRPYRLPTDAEWSHAAGLGGLEKDNATPVSKAEGIKDLYPWGTAWPPPVRSGNFHPGLAVDSFEKTSPAGSFTPTGDGLCDLAGNAWEWCDTLYEPGDANRVLRGGAWSAEPASFLLSSSRFNVHPTFRGDDSGFRVVLGAGG